jgi:ArsR family transcriptional regulator, lead/cadmium/zinc/bismuth-responsive transcriptional repressor
MALNSRFLCRILEFPKHLQVSILALFKLGPSTASDVAAVTGKARANESAYLNQLVVMRIVRRERRGHRVFFSVDLEAA